VGQGGEVRPSLKLPSSELGNGNGEGRAGSVEWRENS
jgi:hypothetical protein